LLSDKHDSNKYFIYSYIKHVSANGLKTVITPKKVGDLRVWIGDFVEKKDDMDMYENVRLMKDQYGKEIDKELSKTGHPIAFDPSKNRFKHITNDRSKRGRSRSRNRSKNRSRNKHGMSRSKNRSKNRHKH